MIAVYTGEEWDRLNAMPEPHLAFTMTCDEGHESVVLHRMWHMVNEASCPVDGCEGRIDCAHARRHVSCPCDEVTAPEPEVLTVPGATR